MDLVVTQLVISHLVGDFMLQTAAMADRKYRPGWIGLLWCTVHVCIYTVVLVGPFGSQVSLLLVIGIFVPHWLVDRYSLSYRWMQLIGRSSLLADSSPTKVAFGVIIYVVIDQTFHLVSLVVLFIFLKP